MRRTNRFSAAICILWIGFFASPLAAQVCTLSITGLNRYRVVSGPVSAECGGDLHSAPFGNWGVTSSVGKKQNSHQFDGWCHDSYVCDNYGSCRTKCRDGWYEWNSCTDHPRYAAPNCSLYNHESCGLQVSTQDIDIHGTKYLDVNTSCPLDTDGDGLCDSGGCKDISSYSEINHFMSLYELDPWDRDSLVQTLYFPELTVPLNCGPWGCPISGSQWEAPVYYDSPVWPPLIYAEAAIAIGWGQFRDSRQVCRSRGSSDPRYNCR
jgi:hypothetical protein